MKVLVTGANGQLGYDVIKQLNSIGIDYLGTDRESLDITNKEQVTRVISDYNPDAVIHCAAYTAVDKAEDEKIYAIRSMFLEQNMWLKRVRKSMQRWFILALTMFLMVKG